MSLTQPNLAIPYPGLRPFDEADHLLFFGRNKQANELLICLEDSAFVAVVGSSGSGKSSLVRAGLLPLLRDGFLFGTDNWKIAVARPVHEPYQRLAGKLTAFRDDVPKDKVLTLLRSSDDGLLQAVDAVCDDSEAHVLVVIDQFEELFGFRRAGDSQRQLRNCASRDEAAAFVAMLLAAARKGEDRLRVMITMRSDFVGDCEVFLGLPQAVSQSQFLVPRLTRSQMEEAIMGPSQILEPFDFEPGLITTLINDAGDQPDQLPLLQHALMRTWKLSDRKHLTAADYTKAGRIEKALSNDADEAWKQLDNDDQQLARQMFLLLCDVSREGQMERRRSLAQEVMGVAQVGYADIERVVRVFQAEDRNFLLPPRVEPISPTTVLDISHEALLRQWDRLRAWLEEEAKSAEEYLRLAGNVSRWKAGNADLLQGRELERALEWKKERNPTAAWAERYHPGFGDAMAHLEESRQAEVAKTRRARINNRLKVLAPISTLGLSVAVSIAFYAHSQRSVAEQAKEQAIADRVTAEKVLAERQDTLSRQLEEERVRADQTTGELNAWIDDYCRTFDAFREEAQARSRSEKASVAVRERFDRADDCNIASVDLVYDAEEPSDLPNEVRQALIDERYKVLTQARSRSEIGRVSGVVYYRSSDDDRALELWEMLKEKGVENLQPKPKFRSDHVDGESAFEVTLAPSTDRAEGGWISYGLKHSGSWAVRYLEFVKQSRLSPPQVGDLLRTTTDINIRSGHPKEGVPSPTSGQVIGLLSAGRIIEVAETKILSGTNYWIKFRYPPPDVVAALDKQDDQPGKIKELIKDMVGQEYDKRRSGTALLIRDYADSTAAIGLVLDELAPEPEKVKKLQPSPRVNVFTYLTRTNSVAWTPELKKRAADALEYMRGNQTDLPGGLGRQVQASMRKFETEYLSP